MTAHDIGQFLVLSVNLLFQLTSLAILTRVILSWLPVVGVRIDVYHPAVRLLYQITDPLLEPLRRFTTFGAVDFSPIVALILLEVARRLLENLLLQGMA
ncbi:MAG: YggT family protein [Anaerolineae bacterium]|nr:YggT family protein [Anaerolineae bacterium]MDW8071091.1 YggT family protein [Anaerolineae bacterium]